MDFKPYYKDWLNVENLFISRTNFLRTIDELYVNLNIDFFKNLKFSPTDFLKYRINAAHKAKEMLGNRPALCISGGVDSQVMLQCWLEADIKFDAFCLVFKNNLNEMDVTHARMVCKNLGVELNEIELDVVKFLNFNNFEYSIKYNSCSPHFNTHYKMFNILREYHYTGISCGGDAPIKNTYNNGWGANFGRNPNTFIKYVEQTNFPVVGNFISFYPHLSWVIALNQKPVTVPTSDGHILTPKQNPYNNEGDAHLRYVEKCESYRKVGLNVYPQLQKYTGFENVKLLLEQQTGDGLEFEKRYRLPIAENLGYSHAYPVFVFRDGIEKFLNYNFN